MELNLNKEITCKRQNQSFLFNKYTSKALYQTLQTTKMNFLKTHNCNPLFNLLEVCPSVPPFVFAVLFLPSFNVLSCYFCVLLNLEAVPRVRIFDNIRDTAPLILNLRSYCL